MTIITAKKEFFALLIIVSALGGYALSTTNTWRAPMLGEATPETQTSPVTQIAENKDLPTSYLFLCLQNKTITAMFHAEDVSLILKDTKNNTSTTTTLPRVASASGAKYANKDQTFVFWQKGNSAFVEDGEEITYRDCMTSGFDN